MQLLEINKENYIGQADPFILETNGRFYIYTTGSDGVYAYSSDELLSGNVGSNQRSANSPPGKGVSCEEVIIGALFLTFFVTAEEEPEEDEYGKVDEDDDEVDGSET